MKMNEKIIFEKKDLKIIENRCEIIENRYEKNR